MIGGAGLVRGHQTWWGGRRQEDLSPSLPEKREEGTGKGQ